MTPELLSQILQGLTLLLAIIAALLARKGAATSADNKITGTIQRGLNAVLNALPGYQPGQALTVADFVGLAKSLVTHLLNDGEDAAAAKVAADPGFLVGVPGMKFSADTDKAALKQAIVQASVALAGKAS